METVLNQIQRIVMMMHKLQALKRVLLSKLHLALLPNERLSPAVPEAMPWASHCAWTEPESLGRPMVKEPLGHKYQVLVVLQVWAQVNFSE